MLKILMLLWTMLALNTGDGGEGGEGKETPPADPKPDPPRTFTQAEVTAIATREKNEGRAAAERAVAEQLGCTPEEAKGIIEAHRKAETEAMSEAERREAAAAERERQAEAREAAALQTVHDTRVERELLRHGASLTQREGESEADATARFDRLRRMVSVGADADEAAVKADVATLKTQFPALFDGTQASTPAPGSDPGPGPRKVTPPGDAMTAGAERARRALGRTEPATTSS